MRAWRDFCSALASRSFRRQAAGDPKLVLDMRPVRSPSVATADWISLGIEPWAGPLGAGSSQKEAGIGIATKQEDPQ